jgi:uncharacterized protein (DUF697 family)
VARKTLPKAIQPPTGDTHDTSAVRSAGERQESPPSSLESSKGSTNQPLPPEPGDASAGGEAAPASQASAPPADTPTSEAAVAGETDADRRRSLAKAIVERHAAYAAVGGIIPVPIANVASITAVIVRMVKVLSGLYGVPFQRDRARAMVIGLMGGTVPTGLAAVTTSTLVTLIPVSSLIGLAVSSVTAIACTRSIGRIFIEHFESGATLHDLPPLERVER